MFATLFPFRRYVLKPRRWILDDRRWTMDDGRWTIDDRRWTICPFLTDEGQICHTIFREFEGIFCHINANMSETLKFVTQSRAKTNKRTSVICLPKDDGCPSSIRFLADEGQICHTFLRDMISIFKKSVWFVTRCHMNY